MHRSEASAPESAASPPRSGNPVVEWILRRPTYRVFAGTTSAKRGTYNLSLAWLLFAVPLLILRGSATTLAIAAILTVNAVCAMLLDDEPSNKMLALSALKAHLASYLGLLLGSLKDTGPCFALLCFIYALAKSQWQTLAWGVSAEAAFWFLYASYITIRVVYLFYSLATLSRRWHTLASPYLVHSANTRSLATAARHELWAFFWGNVGLIVRCAKQLAFIALADFVTRPLVPALVDVPQACLLALRLLLLSFYCYGRLPILIFYKVHRTAHENQNLYQGMHKIHHKGVYASLLDSGTESPAEFMLTETPVVWLVFPPWGFVAMELFSMVLHFAGHITRHTSHPGSVWHLNHHRFLSSNYGVFPMLLDRRFDTAREESYL